MRNNTREVASVTSPSSGPDTLYLSRRYVGSGCGNAPGSELVTCSAVVFSPKFEIDFREGFFDEIDHLVFFFVLVLSIDGDFKK